MMKIIKAIFGGVFLIFAIGCLVNLANLLMGRTGSTEGATAIDTLKWAFFLILSGGAAGFFLWSAFRRPKFGTPVKPPL